MPWSLNYKLMQDINKLPHKSEWKHKYYEVKGLVGIDIEEFVYLNTAEVLKKLFVILSLKDEYDYHPKTHYTTKTKDDQVYDNPWAGKVWQDIQ
ncbi:hypothetical protein FRC11_012378, partial [Ceratobasidium sp. 423]